MLQDFFLFIFNKLTIELIGKSFCYNPCLRMIRNKVTSSYALCNEIIHAKYLLGCLSFGLGKPLLTRIKSTMSEGHIYILNSYEKVLLINLIFELEFQIALCSTPGR